MAIRPEKIVDGRFEIGQVAGSGGMGVVYQARDLKTDRAVALKVLLQRDQGPAERFAHEVELLSSLDHPHIVGYVGNGVTQDGAPYLVMPWLEGIDLQARLKAGPLSIEETLTLARYVADALSCLHGRGFVHRDLKPSNLFLPGGKVENVQVIDLGVARASIAAEELTLSGSLIGTPGFIAPEQARGDREVAPTVDIFALGCVLFECLTGRRLFDGAHLMAVLAKILLEDAPRVSELRPDAPQALDLLVHRMVAKEPERRPRDGAELSQRLADLEEESRVESVPSPLSPTLTGSERRVLTVLVIVLPLHSTSTRPDLEETRAEAHPVYSSSLRFGVRAHFLADRMAIALAPERASAADQAAVLARFACYVVETFPEARVALTTGSAVTEARVPVGEVIERAVSAVRATSADRGVHVDEVTAALLTSRFDIRHEGGRLVVEHERLSLDPTRPLLGKPTSCVGRERELSILNASVAECGDGDGPKVVLVTAGAGAGKSRLRHELVRRLGADVEAPQILLCRGDPMHSTTPYALVSQAIRQAAGLPDGEPRERAREKLRAHVTALVAEEDATRVSDFLGELLGEGLDDAEDLPLRAARHDAAAMGDQIGRAFEDIVRGWSGEKPVVLVLEDLQWGDDPSLKLVDRALRKLAGSHVFVLALARPEVHDRFPALFANRDVLEIRLPPIPKRACATLVREVMGDDIPEDDVDRLVERSEGNGFCLEELIRAAVHQPRGASRRSSMSRDEVPETVVAVTQARLERLEPNLRKVLRAAAIFGDHFWVEGVSALVGQDTTALEPAIAALVEQEAIAPSERPRFAGVRELGFRHALLRGTAYATLTESDRRLGHRLAARWLEQVHQEDGEVVALHWLEAGDRAQAAACFSRTGELRSSRAQTEAAARCATRALLVGDAALETVEVVGARVHALASALEASRSIDARDVMTGLERYIEPLDVGASNASHAVVGAALERSLQVVRAADSGPSLPATLADAACALGALADFVGAKKLLAEAGMRAADDPSRFRCVQYASTKIAAWALDLGTTVALLEETILPAEPRARLEMLLHFAMAVVMVDGRSALARSLDLVSRAEAILAARVGGEPPREDPVALVRCVKQRYFCFVFAGEYAKAADAAEEAVAIARRAGLRFDEFAHLHNAGEQYLRLGQRDRARTSIEQSNAIAFEIGAGRNQRHNDVLLAYLDGRPDRLESLAEDARAASDAWLELYARYWLGQLLASTRARDARPALERALDLAKELKLRTMAEECAGALAGLSAS
jgi:serine/threonine protein kinase/tetratricopeptide (TPR) repeat protein